MTSHKETFLEMLRLCQEGRAFVLATVVKTIGSTPRKPGAKLLIRSDGTTQDTLGGGCVEAEVWQEAMLAMGTGKSTVREFQLSDDLAAESGLVCGGTMEILIDAVTGKESLLPVIQKVLSALDGGGKVALATVIQTSESSILIGDKILYEANGNAVLNRAGVESRDDLVREVALHTPLIRETGLVSVGGTELFVEVFQSLDTILIVGAGHIAKALGSIAKLLGFRVVVVDDREEFANRQRFPEADEVIAAPIVPAVREFPISDGTFVVVATRGHQLDYEVLRQVVESPAAYVRMVSSRRKVVLFYQQLVAAGLSPEKVRRIHAPAGLNLGAITPEEIAFSIMAEITMEKLGGDGQPLKFTPNTLLQSEK
ncbi:MAG: XdhC/CoxI family protein [Dehalococcoidales bacterium]|nr:XdhC/CoxI family protein [Dehalococcoidales bacterium]